MKIHVAATFATLATVSAFVPTSTTPKQSTATVARFLFREDGETNLAQVALASVLSLVLVSNPLPALADGQTEKFKLPPIDRSDKNRCSLNSSSIGQANAARDKLYDLRECQLSGASAPGFDLSGVIMTKTDVSKVDFKEAYFSKGYLQGKTRMKRFCLFVLPIFPENFLFSEVASHHWAKSQRLTLWMIL